MDWASDVAWGDVSSWVTAVAAVLALLFAAIAAKATRGTFHVHQARDAEVKRSQAAAVSAWWAESKQQDQGGVWVRNASSTPVYQAHLTVRSVDDRCDVAALHLGVIPPSERPEFYAVDRPATGSSPVRVVDGDERRVRLSFTDAAGVSWLRNEYGRLKETDQTLAVATDGPRVSALARFRDDFAEASGVTLALQTLGDGDVQSSFVDQRGKPIVDVLIGAHDWTGNLVRHEAVQPIVLAPQHAAAFRPWTVAALTYRGRLYGVPATVDTVALLRNTELAPEPPQSLDDLVAEGQRLRDAGQVTDVLALRSGDIGDPFQLWPLFTSAGGRLFDRRPDGTVDMTLDTPGTIAAFERLRAMGEAGTGVLRRMDRGEALQLFADGRCAYLVTTVDGLAYARAAGVPVSVSAVPAFADGRPAATLTLVHGLFMAKGRTNSAIAPGLLADYLTQPRVATALSAGVVAPVALINAGVQDPELAVYQQLCEVGTPMPSVPQMQAVWRVLGHAQVEVIRGAQAHDTVEAAAAELTRLSGVDCRDNSGCALHVAPTEGATTPL